jgi:hypothetical protein
METLDAAPRLWEPSDIEVQAMRVFLAGLFAVSLIARAQSPAPSQATVHAPDGGVRETLQSIMIPPLTGAPFTATVTTEWTHLLPDGTTATVKNHRTVARDSTGRIFEERRAFTPTGDQQPTRLTNTNYIDPNRHEYFDCMPMQRSCHASEYFRPAMDKMPPYMDGLRACGCASPAMAGAKIDHEALGEKNIEDIAVIGSREITTIATGAIGNPNPEPIVKEFWYSPRLGINIVTKRFDPRSGIANFYVSGISLSEPDPRLFQPPQDFEIVRQVVERAQSPQTK